jgi:hypothetical protein
MGSSVSKIDYENIYIIIDNIIENSRKPYQHTITFQNKKVKIYKFNKNEEEEFQLSYKCTKLYEKVRKIDYYNIESVRYTNIKENIKENKNNENIYILTILYFNETIKTIQLNQLQYDFFITTYKKLNKNPKLPD